LVTPGQCHESTQLGALLDKMRVARRGCGRPRKRPERVLAGRGYSFPSCRLLLRGRGILHTIPEWRDQQKRRQDRPGRSPSFDAALYARRNVAEHDDGSTIEMHYVLEGPEDAPVHIGDLAGHHIEHAGRADA
jgi:hypothetical protein